MQQNTFNKEMKFDSMPRERPLQKSMLLPDSQMHPTSPTSRGNPLEFSVYTPMKKSLISTHQNTINSASNIAYNQNNFTFNPNPANFQPNNMMGSAYQSRISVQTEPGYQSYTLKSLLSPYKNELKSEQSPEDYPRIYSKHEKSGNSIVDNKQNQSLNSNSETLIQQILNQLKDKHLPNILTKLKKQIYDDIHNIRLEFQSLREEMRSNVKKQDSLLNELKVNQGNMMSFNANIHPLGSYKVKNDKEDEVAELQTHYFLLEGKLSQIQARMLDSSKVLQQQFQKLTLKLQKQSKNLSQPLKVSLIRSNLPPVMLEYKETFTFKKPSTIFKQRQRQEQEMVLSQCIYFVDKLGYLMDNQNRYIVDTQGLQIRLEDKHLRILESHKILQK